MLDATREWLRQAEYDVESAQHMLAAGRWLHAVFFCHLAVEKSLKAAIVEKTNQTPPRTHNLIALAQVANLHLPVEYAEFLGMINDAGVVTRYPQDLSQALSEYPEEVAWDYLLRSREVMEWIRQQIESDTSSEDTVSS
ncbi:MAG: HEPN domain-containing protein [bacterium]|nr:HEPN domain-containing protein [bacterium]